MICLANEESESILNAVLDLLAKRGDRLMNRRDICMELRIKYNIQISMARLSGILDMIELFGLIKPYGDFGPKMRIVDLTHIGKRYRNISRRKSPEELLARGVESID